jgi:hypothetical protein
VLFLDHSVEGLARGGPWLLGTVLRGSCSWRTMNDAETAIHGGSSRRRLYGCVVTMLRPPAALGGDEDDSVQPLLTWSQVCAALLVHVTCMSVCWSMLSVSTAPVVFVDPWVKAGSISGTFIVSAFHLCLSLLPQVSISQCGRVSVKYTQAHFM